MTREHLVCRALRWVGVGFVALALCAGTQARGQENGPAMGPAYMEALQDAVDSAIGDMAGTDLREEFTIAVLPIENDADARCYELVRISLSRAGFRVFERLDEEWENLLQEIEWGQRRDDIMDAASVQKFGHIQGVSAIMYGRILDVASSERGEISLRVSLHVSQVETGQHLWGDSAVGASELVPEQPFYVTHAKYLFLGVVILLLIVIIVRAIGRATRPR
ncbi:MAG: hypothetical protein KAY32_09830 [Candidatus Eisenbacteria sp.]|nr:hypothetical protein [Candidatus Eisenbacteria bacterium]